MLIKFLLAIVFCEAMTEILKEAVVLEPLRSPFRRWAKFNEFMECGYCQSVWVGWGTGFLFQMEVGLGYPWYVEAMIFGFLAHRLSNLWHEMIVRWLHRHPFQMVLFKNVQAIAPEEPEEEEDVETLQS